MVDVAKAHILAMTSDNASGQRFIVSEKALWLSDIAKILKNNGFKKIPSIVIPNFLVGLLSFFLKDIALFKDRLGKSQITKSDNAKKLLRWRPGFVEEAIVDTAKKYKETRNI